MVRFLRTGFKSQKLDPTQNLPLPTNYVCAVEGRLCGVCERYRAVTLLTFLKNCRTLDTNMTKRDLMDLVARKAHLTKRAATESVEVFLDEIGRILSKGEKIVLSGFGTFRVISMKGKTVKIPKTDKLVTIKAHRSPRFTPGKRLKRQVSR